MKLKRPLAHQTGSKSTRDTNGFPEDTSLAKHKQHRYSLKVRVLRRGRRSHCSTSPISNRPSRIAHLESPISTCSPRGRTRVTHDGWRQSSPPTRRTRPSRWYFSVNCSHTVATTRPTQVLSAIQPSFSSYVLASVIVAPDLQVCPTTQGNSPANQKIFHTGSSCFIHKGKHLPDMLRQLRPPSVAISLMHYGRKKGHQGTRGY